MMHDPLCPIFDSPELHEDTNHCPHCARLRARFRAGAVAMREAVLLYLGGNGLTAEAIRALPVPAPPADGQKEK